MPDEIEKNRMNKASEDGFIGLKTAARLTSSLISSLKKRLSRDAISMMKTLWKKSSEI